MVETREIPIEAGNAEEYKKILKRELKNIITQVKAYKKRAQEIKEILEQLDKKGG